MIIPQPRVEMYHEGTYKMKKKVDTIELISLYNIYKNGNEDVEIKIVKTLGVDDYDIDITEDGIKITASGDCGVFRAVSSLRQLIRYNGDSLPFCTVKDSPDFEKRSYLFDISCGRMPTVATFKRLIDMLADLKYNEFQIYLEGRCFQYEEFAKYTEEFECLNAKDMEELDEYCAQRFIDFIPNQNSFGHLGEWLSLDDFKHLRVGNDEVNTATINPLLDESFDFIDKFCSSLLPHFRSEYMNIGFDEAVGLGKYQLEEICKEKGADNVFMDWLNKLADHVREKYGKKVQFWADMVYDSPDAYKRVPEGAIALNWGYDMIKSSMMERHCYDLWQHNIPFYVCPGNSNWLSTTGRFDVMSFNLRTAGEMGVKYGAKGYMLTDWGCGEGHHHFPVWGFIPMALASIYSWHVGVKQHGGWLKNENIRASWKYVDDFIFDGAQVSEWLYRLQMYYHLEPEKVHSASFACHGLVRTLLDTNVAPFYDLKEVGDVFYFENVLQYMNRCIEGVSKVDFDEHYKRQVLINANMVVLGTKLSIVKYNQTVTKDEAEALKKDIDDIIREYEALWPLENYPEKRDWFPNYILERKKELDVLIK